MHAHTHGCAAHLDPAGSSPARCMAKHIHTSGMRAPLHRAVNSARRCAMAVTADMEPGSTECNSSTDATPICSVTSGESDTDAGPKPEVAASLDA